MSVLSSKTKSFWKAGDPEITAGYTPCVEILAPSGFQLADNATFPTASMEVCRKNMVSRANPCKSYKYL